MTASVLLDRRSDVLRDAGVHAGFDVARFPQRLTPEAFYPFAYRAMYYTRVFEARMMELFKKGYVKGTVTDSCGNEATAVGMSMPLRPGYDIASILHRDFAAHMLLGADPYKLVCQYLANAESPTHGREGNVHHGDAHRRRFPMISHLGQMLSTVVGATWAARRNGEDVCGLAVIGDGGSSTGDFHEAINLAAVQKSPVLFLVQNNYYSFSTPISYQFRCRQLSDRAAGYGIVGRTIDGLDPWLVYTSVCDALEAMQADALPQILECVCTRLHGHAAYDKGEYMDPVLVAKWREQDPVPNTRQRLLAFQSEEEIASVEKQVEEEIRAVVARALEAKRPDPQALRWTTYADTPALKVKPYQAAKVKNGEAIKQGMDFILANDPQAFVLGLDVGVYGSAFKTCKGLIEKYGPERVIDLPICESGTVGFAIGASQVGGGPIIEFQFADFSTEAVTQLGLNAATWYYRSGREAPLLLRFPCGGGLTLGAFHSGEMEGLWSRFPGLKLLYPATAQECYEAIVAGFYDRNPCLVFEHKLLYWSKSSDIDFDGNLQAVWRPRRYSEGDEITVVALGAMVHEALAAAGKLCRGVEVWNPFVLNPLDPGPIVESVEKTRRLLVVQECPESQGLGDRIVSLIVRKAGHALRCAPRLLSAPEVPVPFAPELEAHYRQDAEKIRRSIEEMLREG